MKSYRLMLTHSSHSHPLLHYHLPPFIRLKNLSRFQLYGLPLPRNVSSQRNERRQGHSREREPQLYLYVISRGNVLSRFIKNFSQQPDI